MKRLLTIFALAIFCTACAHAQMSGMRPGRPQRSQQDEGPKGEQKLRYICKLLKLNDDQMQQAEALIAIYKAEVAEQREDPSALLQKIQDKYAELRAAKQDGNTELARKLQQELKNMAPGVQAENHFFAGLEQILTNEQKTKLPEIREMAARAGDISIRPIHVFQAAQAQGLTLEQRKELEKTFDQHRRDRMTNRPEGKEDEMARVDQLIEQVRDLLKPEQVQSFNDRIEALRGAAPPPQPVKVPSNSETPNVSQAEEKK